MVGGVGSVFFYSIVWGEWRKGREKEKKMTRKTPMILRKQMFPTKKN